MENLKENGTIVYLKLPVRELEKRLSNIHTRGVAMKKGETIYDVYNVRAPLYEKYADATVELDNSHIEDSCEKILKLLNTEA